MCEHIHFPTFSVTVESYDEPLTLRESLQDLRHKKNVEITPFRQSPVKDCTRTRKSQEAWREKTYRI